MRPTGFSTMALRDPKATARSDVEATVDEKKAIKSIVTVYPTLHNNGSDPSTPSSIQSLQKPECSDSTTSAASAEELPPKLAKTIFYLRITRITIRVITTVISIASFSTILYTLIIYLNRIRNRRDSQNKPPPTGLRPGSSFVFAGVSFAALIINFVLLVATGLSSAIREISNFSNAIMALAGVGGFSSLIAGCANMHIQWHKRDLWGWACYKAAQELTEYDPNFRYKDVCHFTTTSWNLGIVQATLEVAMVVNVCIAAAILRREKLMKMRRLVPGLRGNEDWF